MDGVQDATKKIVLLGNSGVGKTSLATRWLNDKFDPLVRQTVGASNAYREVTVDDHVVRVTLWDTAGQEQYRSITPLYMRGARCGIIVASCDLQESLDAIPSWLELLASVQAEPIPAVLAINKSDMMNSEQEEQMTKTIELYRPYFQSFFLVSAFSGDNVTELFKAAAKAAEATPSAQEMVFPTMVEGKSEQSCC